MMDLIASIENVWPHSTWTGSTLVVAVSGGPDSMVLLHALHSIDRGHSKLIVAHLNHRLRGQESEEDESFVARTAEQLSLNCITERIDWTGGSPMANSAQSESGLRKTRYQFLQRVAIQNDASWIVTGHNADDAIETFLMNLFRGTGPKGLASIPLRRTLKSGVTLVRPMRNIRRCEITKYLDAQKCSFRIDSTNAQSIYARNRVRNELLPYLREFFDDDRIDDRILQAIDLIRDDHLAIKRLAGDYLGSDAFRLENESFCVSVELCRAMPWPILREALCDVWMKLQWPLGDFGKSHWDQVRDLVEQSKSTTHPLRLHVPGGVELLIRQRILSGKRIDQYPSIKIDRT